MQTRTPHTSGNSTNSIAAKLLQAAVASRCSMPLTTGWDAKRCDVIRLRLSLKRSWRCARVLSRLLRRSHETMAAPCKADRRPGFLPDICRRGEAAYAECYRSWAGNGAGERERGTTDKSKDARRIEARATGPLGRDELVRSD